MDGQPSYAPNVVNQTVGINGKTFRGNPGQGWTDVTAESQQNDLQSKVAAQAAADKAATDARFAQGKSDITDFNTRYGAAVPKIINDTSNKYRLGDLLGASQTSTGDLRTAQYNIGNTGAGGYASNDQVNNAINTRLSPKQALDAENLMKGTTLAQNEENMLLTPYNTESTLLNDRLAREATGYSQEQQRTLDGLIAAMNNGTALTTAQMKNATDLAIAEKNYQATVNAATIGNNKPQSINAGNYVYDPASGQYKLLR